MLIYVRNKKSVLASIVMLLLHGEEMLKLAEERAYDLTEAPAGKKRSRRQLGTNLGLMVGSCKGAHLSFVFIHVHFGKNPQFSLLQLLFCHSKFAHKYPMDMFKSSHAILAHFILSIEVSLTSYEKRQF